MIEERTKVLLIEPQNSLCMSVMFSLECEFNFHVIDCHTVGVAERMLEINDDIQLFIIPAEIEGHSTYDFFSVISEQFPGVPIICTDEDKVAAWESKPNYLLKKTGVFTPLSKMIRDLFCIDEDTDKSEHTKVSLKALTCIDGLKEDAYIMLLSGRLLKLFSSGDTVTAQDIERYSSKGVSHLYLEKEACLWILKQLEKHVEGLVNNPEMKVDLEESYEKDARELFDDVDEETYIENVFEQEREFVQEVHKKTKQVVNNIRQNRSLMKLLSKIKFEKGKGSFIKNRIQMVSSISCALAREMGFSTDMTYEKLIYAAHVHDIMLIDNPNLARFQTLTEATLAMEAGEITKSDFERFHKHTVHAYELVRKDPTAPPDAAIMVTQHHELPGGAGFPQKLASGRINAFTAILAVAIDVSNFLLLSKEKDLSIYINAHSEKFRGGSFIKAIQALAALGKVKTSQMK